MDTVYSIPEILEAQKSTNWQVKAMLLTTDHSWGNHRGSHVYQDTMERVHAVTITWVTLVPYLNHLLADSHECIV